MTKNLYSVQISLIFLFSACALRSTNYCSVTLNAVISCTYPVRYKICPFALINFIAHIDSSHLSFALRFYTQYTMNVHTRYKARFVILIALQMLLPTFTSVNKISMASFRRPGVLRGKSVGGPALDSLVLRLVPAGRT